MIRSSAKRPIAAFEKEQLDLFVYGLGYEVRSTALASLTGRTNFAIRMDGPAIHALQRNLGWAKTSKEALFAEDLATLKDALATKLRKTDGLRIGFDISSVNRAILFDLLVFFSANLREADSLVCYYVPARFQKPDLRFPQIESFGPSSRFFSGFQSDPTFPLCLVLGAGFEAGISMGIISQLEPRRSFCFWGSGVDARFDRLVRETNHGFRYPTFEVQAIEYPLEDPLTTFNMLESLTYGMLRDHRVIIAPMGPKIFSLLAALVAMEHFGMVAVWRVKHSRATPGNAVPSGEYIRVELNIEALLAFGSCQAALLEAA